MLLTSTIIYILDYFAKSNTLGHSIIIITVTKTPVITVNGIRNKKEGFELVLTPQIMYFTTFKMFAVSQTGFSLLDYIVSGIKSVNIILSNVRDYNIFYTCATYLRNYYAIS